jgi:hypothetical protein
MNAMGLNWFTRSKSQREHKTNEAVTRAIEARVTVEKAANRLTRVLEIMEGSRMEHALERLVNVRHGGKNE